MANSETVVFTKAGLRNIAEALRTVVMMLELASGDAPGGPARIREDAAEDAAGEPEPEPEPASGADKPVYGVLAEDSARGQMARRWREVCKERNIPPEQAERILKKVKGHYKNAILMAEGLRERA